MSAPVESPQKENVEPDADAVSDSDASQEPCYCGKKSADLRSVGPTILWTGTRLQTRFDDYPGQNPGAADLRLKWDSELNLTRGRLKGAGCSAN